jgi:ribonuclease BN (tRNA processing enzyme)
MQTDERAEPVRPDGRRRERRLEQVEIRLLGSGGFVPTARRETASALLRRGDEAVVIDAGTGAHRLRDEPQLLEGVERLHVVLTHFHLDHTVGLFFLPGIGPPVEIWGAGEALEGIPTSALIERLLGSPFAPDGFIATFAAVHELPATGARIGPFDVRARIQRLHSNPTLALRFGDELVWCTDTSYDVENVEFARGARLLCHEAFRAADRSDEFGHTAAGDAARLAAAAGVDRLLLVHVNPEAAADEPLLEFARDAFPATDVASDGLVVAT